MDSEWIKLGYDNDNQWDTIHIPWCDKYGNADMNSVKFAVKLCTMMKNQELLTNNN